MSDAKPHAAAAPSLVGSVLRLGLDAVIVLARAVGFLLLVIVGLPIVLVPLTIIGPIVLVGFIVSVPFSGVYRSTLTRVYMRHKLSPLFAAVVVTLCTMMVIIVISVMGGFLDLMRGSARQLTSDVIIYGDLRGFPHFDELSQALIKLPEVEATTPVMQGYGLFKVGDNVRTVEVLGVRPDSMDDVIGFRKSLYWKKSRFAKQLQLLKKRQQSDMDPAQFEHETRTLNDMTAYDFEDYGMQFMPPQEWLQRVKDGKAMPGIVPGIEVSGFHRRSGEGQYDIRNSIVASKALLTVLPISEAGMVTEPSVREFMVVNEFKSGLYEIDERRVYVPFELLQKMLRMDGYQAVDDNGDPTGEIVHGRASRLLVRGADGVALKAISEAVDRTLDQFRETHKGMLLTQSMTWEQRHATLLNAVENEKGMITFLFAIISIVAFIMVATVFYNIVLEKTRDIGVLRAIGASRFGVANIFVGYGLCIGIVGSLLGVGIALLIVFNLNEIQDLLGDKMVTFIAWIVLIALLGIAAGVTGAVKGRKRDAGAAWGLMGVVGAFAVGVIAAYFFFDVITVGAIAEWNQRIGWRMWNPKTYYFDQVPEQVSVWEVTFICIGAIMSCVLGSLIPAIVGARLDPVEALRYE